LISMTPRKRTASAWLVDADLSGENLFHAVLGSPGPEPPALHSDVADDPRKPRVAGMLDGDLLELDEEAPAAVSSASAACGAFGEDAADGRRRRVELAAAAKG
jgi:hypothetical protein